MFDKWFEGRRWAILIALCAVLLGILVSAPQWLHTLDERYEGVPTHLNSDEFSYLPRLQEALLGHSDRIGIAVGGGSVTSPLQSALIERVYGFFFRPFGWSAAKVLTVMDFVAPFLLFLVLVGFLRACGFSRRHAFVAAWLFCLLELYNLGRPVHQRMSFLLTLLALWGIIEGLERSVLWGVLGGILLGLLLDVYFWSWTAAWAWWGILLLGAIIQAVRIQGSSLRDVRRLLLFGGIGALSAAPIIWGMTQAAQHPVYQEVFFRSGIGHSRMPESWPWTILFMLMAIGVVLLWWPKRERRTTYLVCTVVTAFAILNQHIIHGTLFLFASHYLFFLVFAGVLTLVFSCRQWGKWGLMATLAAGIYLSGIAYDSRYVIKQWRVDAGSFEEQYFATAIPVLEGISQTMILTDPDTSNSIASHTLHDVLFTRYIMHEIKTHHEIAQRYCLTVLPFLEDGEERTKRDHRYPVYGAAYDAAYTEGAKASLQHKELQLVNITCATAKVYMRDTLKKYGVEYVFWNEQNHPDWDPKRLGVPLKIVEREEGWSLWRLR